MKKPVATIIIGAFGFVLITEIFFNSAGDSFAADLSVTATVPAICGNGAVEGSEECDDGNTANGDTCSSSCSSIGGSPIPVSPTPAPTPATPAPTPAPTPTPAPPAPPESEPENQPASPESQPVAPTPTPAPSSPTAPVPSGGGGPATQPASGGDNAATSTTWPATDNPEVGLATSSNETAPDGKSSVEPERSSVTTSTDRLTPVIKTLATVGKGLQSFTGAVKKTLNNFGPTLETKAQSLVEATKDAAVAVQEFVADPQVQSAAKEVVIPSTVVISAAVTTSGVSGFLWPLLRFIFLQPILLFSRRKRTSWGIVYNSLNKMPLDLATVRLVSTTTGKIIQSRVTDSAGRYFLIAQPGDYRLEVARHGYAYPTTVLADATSDGTWLDIYHGEIIRVSLSGTNLVPNIPLDPSGEHQTPERIIRHKRWQIAQHVLALTGVVITGLGLLIAPTWYMVMWLLAQICLYLVTLLYIKPRRPTGWGLVSDATTHAPVGRAVARLFSRQYNKLISTEITDAGGRYAFLVGPSEYYVTVEKAGYVTQTAPVIVAGPEAVLITEKIMLNGENVV